MKKFDSSIKDYVSKLSFDELRYLSERFEDRIGSDLAEAAEAVSKSAEMDKWLASAKNAMEFYDMLDRVQYFVNNELYKRTPEVVEA